MKKNYIKIENNHNFIVCNDQNTNSFQVIERIIDSEIEKEIYIMYHADKYGHAVSNIKNNYFQEEDPQDIFNYLGSIEYKKFLLNRIKTDLFIRNIFETQEKEKTR